MTVGCSSETVVQAEAAVREGFNGWPSISTHVIAVGDTENDLDVQWWAAVPSAGGGTLHNTSNVGQSAILEASVFT